MSKYIEPNDLRIPEAIKIAQRYMLSGTPEEPKEI